MLRKVLNPVIGLGAEAYAHRQNKKKDGAGSHEERADDQPPAYETVDHNPPPSEPAAERAEDEGDWELDEAAHQAEPAAGPLGSCVPQGTAAGPASVDEIVRAFLAAYPVQATGYALPCPVVIPQKRPGAKTRGFVRAYAPVLEAVGIGERAWMDFLRSFEEAIRVSPVFDAVNVGVQAVGIAATAIHSPTLSAAVTAVTVADVAAQRVYQRSRYNDFLAQLNARFFQPLGLFCLIMTYDPHSNAARQPWDLAAALATTERDADATGLKLNWKTLKGVQGSTRGEAEMPQSAELVYPALDAQLDAPDGAWSRGRAFVESYMDKRAQAHYASTHPDTALAMAPQFESSRGGMGTEQRTVRERLQQRGDQREQRQATRPSAGRGRGLGLRRAVGGGDGGGPLSLLVTAASGGKLKGRDARPVNIVRRTLRPGAMYLLVTAMPTAEEMAAARELLEWEGQGKTTEVAE